MSLSSNSSITIPTLDQLQQNVLNDIQAELPESNPFIDQQFLKVTGTVFAGIFNEMYIYLIQLIKAMFLQPTAVTTMTSYFLNSWAAVWGIYRQAGTYAVGNVNFEGVVGTVIPQGTVIQSKTGNSYTSDADATVTSTTASNLNGNISGSTITIIYDNHGLATGNTIQVTGSSQAEVNGSHQITVIDENSFAYDIESVLPPGSITGLSVTSVIAVVYVTSDNFGDDQNVGQGQQMSLQTQIAGISNNGKGFVPYGEIKGGSDEETDDEMNARLLYRIRNPIGEFSTSDINQNIYSLKLSIIQTVISPFDEIAPAPSPEPGQVIIIVVGKDDDETIRNPTTTELDLVKDSLGSITPANCVVPNLSNVNVYVREPIALFNIDIVISNLYPGNTSMENAITNNLKVYFADTVQVSRGDPDLAYTNFITMNAITTIIGGTIDTSTGQQPSEFNFTLNGGTSNIIIPVQNRAILNSVTFL